MKSKQTMSKTLATPRNRSRPLNTSRMGDMADYLAEQMQDPEFAREYAKAKRETDFALGLVMLREAQGLTQEQLGAKSGIPQETVSRLERGRVPALPTLKRLAKALNATVLILPDERVLLQSGTVAILGGT